MFGKGGSREEHIGRSFSRSEMILRLRLDVGRTRDFFLRAEFGVVFFSLRLHWENARNLREPTGGLTEIPGADSHRSRRSTIARRRLARLFQSGYTRRVYVRITTSRAAHHAPITPSALMRARSHKSCPASSLSLKSPFVPRV